MNRVPNPAKNGYLLFNFFTRAKWLINGADFKKRQFAGQQTAFTSIGFK